ncbi:MAG: 5,6-dimethylbenzimidazole synthase [Zoogloea sp.]|nr:5,6-dimethylbenzimidazole synthase [Zoogloea sp.]
MSQNLPFRYSDPDIAAVYRAIRERRDVRHFIPGELPEGCLERLLDAAHAGPSVGFMQPWRFLHITRPELRTAIHALVDEERQRTAEHLPSRQQEFLRLKVEGVRECAELLVVALMDGREPHIFGRRTMPEMDLASASCAIQNLWLAARAEGVGVGWVSIFDPDALARLLHMPSGARPIAVLCIGPVAEFPASPLLGQLGWGERLPRSAWLFEDEWPADALPTPVAY